MCGMGEQERKERTPTVSQRCRLGRGVDGKDKRDKTTVEKASLATTAEETKKSIIDSFLDSVLNPVLSSVLGPVLSSVLSSILDLY